MEQQNGTGGDENRHEAMLNSWRNLTQNLRHFPPASPLTKLQKMRLKMYAFL